MTVEVPVELTGASLVGNAVIVPVAVGLALTVVSGQRPSVFQLIRQNSGLLWTKFIVGQDVVSVTLVN